ncbi:hypothetical protein HYW76_01210 [Candidatus Pacearchaeota archaeon]|nr:hypothetical protein [Candidatus Pacearchaeota archaeon]
MAFKFIRDSECGAVEGSLYTSLILNEQEYYVLWEDCERFLKGIEYDGRVILPKLVYRSVLERKTGAVAVPVRKKEILEAIMAEVECLATRDRRRKREIN